LQKSDVSIVIPALNEAYLPKLKKKLKDYDVHVQSEKGLSFAVWKGIQKAEGEIVVVLDADGSHPTGSIMDMCSRLSLSGPQVWFIIGSRYCQGGYSFDSLPRKIISRFYCILAQLILRTSIKDSMSGFWVGYRHVFQFTPTNGYKFSLQLIRRYSGHIQEFPIIFRKRKIGKSHIKASQSLRDFCEIFRVLRIRKVK